MARFTILRCRRIREELSEFDIWLFRGEICDGDSFSFNSGHASKKFKVLEVRKFEGETTIVCAGALDYDNEITNITLDSVPPYGTGPILRPIPPDVVDRIQTLFPMSAEEIIQRLSFFRHEGECFVGDRVVRCIVFCLWRSQGQDLEQWIEIARRDFRDIIMSAEYGRDLLQERLYDFNRPFRDEDFSTANRDG